MTTPITEVDEYTAQLLTVADGDAANAATMLACLQPIANRTRNLKSTLDLFNPARNQVVVISPTAIPANTFSGGATGVLGTAALRAPDNTNYSTRKFRVGFVSTVGLNATAGVLFYTAYAGNAGYFSRESGFALKFGCVLAAVNSGYAWLHGLGTGADFGLVQPSTRLNAIFLGADAGDVNAQIMFNDGAGVCTKVDLGANFPARTANDYYDLLLWCAPGSATFNYTVNRHTAAGAVFTVSGTIAGANVPIAGVQWYPMSACCTGGSGLVAAIDSTGFTLAVPH